MIRDEFTQPEVRSSRTVYSGLVWDVVRESFILPESGDDELVRDFVLHPGAVAVAAVDDSDRILLIQQYRHPVRAREWEIPAGLLDVSGEDPALAAARELREEADLHARTWHTLADQSVSPGGWSEVLRIYLARDITHSQEAFTREAEELGIVPRWLDLDEAVDSVLGGGMTNATAALAVLHCHHARARGWQGLRPVDAPWPSREAAPRRPGR